MKTKTIKDIYFKTVEIPHLRFTIHFLDMSKLKGQKIVGSGYTCVMEDGSICIFIQDIEKTVRNLELIPYVAHEIMHAIQFICEKLGMRIEEEQEHTAYLMFYLLSEVINSKVTKIKEL